MTHGNTSRPVQATAAVLLLAPFAAEGHATDGHKIVARDLDVYAFQSIRLRHC